MIILTQTFEFNFITFLNKESKLHRHHYLIYIELIRFY